ncbi:MAG: DUF86 domain-containing protein [Acidobacteria bacterium]|nr:DUF86 domain-containing protein [Acidobacteriota bacterium]
MRPPVNMELIRSRAADIRGELPLLSSYAAMGEDAFAGNPERVRAARYSLVVVVEAAAAICSHLLARLGQAPDSYPGCFQALGREDVIPEDLAARLIALARMRNILVHGFGRVDDRRLHGALRDDLPDIEEYLRHVATHVGERPGLGRIKHCPCRGHVMEVSPIPTPRHRRLSEPERRALLDRLASRLSGEPDVLFAYAFGSLAESRAAADVDVAAYLTERPTDPLRREMDLVGAVEGATGFPADVVLLNDAPVGLRLAAVRGVLVLSRDDTARMGFVERTCLDAMDTEYLRRSSLRDLLIG